MAAVACGSTPPLPTYTPLATHTPAATYTPLAPLPTYTPLATYTPLPTYIPLPTQTPLPTYTPLATYTPLPTYIPLPTQTPLPTYTPYPTTSAPNTPAATTETHPADSGGEKSTIVFSDLNWPSAQVQNRIAQYIVEKGYGYPTDIILGSTLPLFQGLRRGDTQVTMEIWLPNQLDAWNEAMENDEVVQLGPSLGADWQSAFVIPAYLQEQYPDLDNVEDLKDDKFKQLLATTETQGKVRLVSCVIGWACEEYVADQIVGYGLTDHVHIINPGDGTAANADLYDAYEKGDPWIGYQWGTNDPPLVLDLTRLEEPAYSDECWATTKACAFQNSTVLIAVHPDLLPTAPDVADMLGNWEFTVDVYKSIAVWMRDNEGASENEAALWWLSGNADIWSDWVTVEAAAAIQAALDANEIPDGWPTE